MNHTEWQEIRGAAAELTGDEVLVKLINGQRIVGHLTGVGAEGLCMLKKGYDFETTYRSRLIASVEPYHRPEVTVPRG